MKQHLRTINLSDPVEYLTHPDAVVHALRHGYCECQPEGTEAEKPHRPKRKKKEDQR